jgi:uracil-DNA glycosylase family 4
MESDKKTDKTTSKLSFVDGLFANVDWAYTGVEAISPLETQTDQESSHEKKHILESLKEFAFKEAIENKVEFNGGEIRLKSPLVECKTQTELVTQWQELLKPVGQEIGQSLDLVYELKDSPLKVLFVGDYSKGSHEQCFQGEVREMLLKMISAMKLGPSDFALTTLVKQSKFPEGKLKELGRESLALLHHEILFYKPQYVISLGAFATTLLLGTEERLSSIHGEFFERDVQASNGIKHTYQIMPIFHPEFLLINPNMKKTTWVDLQKVMKNLGHL